MASVDAFKAVRQQLLERREDYTEAYEIFEWPKLDTFNWALDWFDDYAADNDRLALWLVDADGSEERYSFEDMRRRSNQVANFLRAQGVSRGDTILLMLDNVVELWETMLATIKLGAVVIPATTLLSQKDLGDRLGRGGVTHVVAAEAHVAKFEGVADGLTRIVVGAPVGEWAAFEQAYAEDTGFTPEGVTRATDPLLLYFTSGTTSQPKLVLHTHQSYPVGSLSTMYWLGLQPDDIHFNISSPGWAKHAWSNLFAPWDAGCTVFVYRTPRFSAPEALQVIADKGVTSLCAPPTVWRLLIQEDLSAYDVSLKSLVGAGEPLNPEVIDRVGRLWGLSIRDGYGQTETTAQIGNSPGQEMKPGSMGRPLPGYRIALLDPFDQEHDEGEIAIDVRHTRPLGLMQEYRDDPERMAKALHDGYYRTGDVARRDADGYYWYVGRADDVFKSSDYRISPFELESILIEHESVAEAAVVPAPDEMKLSVPKAYIVLRRGHEPGSEAAKALFAFSRERMAPYQRIRELEFAELPKTISGKIRRVELRAHAAERNHGEHGYAESDFPELRA
ncbi:AMP-binding protein [Salinisphaera orenii]|uniref:AMP-dependent synthetase n=1 Tax=Salinisphaera orenii YIM 95161 TaxID=1051139 RepID=A0A423PRF2_9GAMM|nr:AMP-binding protein [Salinisphaera halophila]ROO28196.1 AMP-dependent synthetase [Salinisphaera halophila YIM 95161]